MEIKYLTYQQVNKIKWDACIDHAPNGLLYAGSYYLNNMARHWDALVLNDYEAVMPLTWNKKYGIHYLYQPPFTACLGVFGKPLTAETVNAFLKAIPEKFRYWDICLNPGNPFKVKDFDLYKRMNFVLNLEDSYDNLYSAFSDNIKRNIKKSAQVPLTVSKNIAITEVIKPAKEQAGNFSSLSDADFKQFEKLFRLLHGHKKATTYGVYTTAGQLMASAVFFFSHNRAYYIMVGNHPDGKSLGASHALIHAFIKDHAGQNLLLDFEGSDIPGLAFFYRSFGAKEEPYPAIRLNKLPAPIRWLKP